MKLFEKAREPVLAPSAGIPWASGAVFNPGVWYDGRIVHMLFRAVPSGYRRIPLQDVEPGEPTTGFDDYVSSIGYARSTDGIRFEIDSKPFLTPDRSFDRFGVEDPRISRIDGEYFITYTALSQPAFGSVDGVRIGLASTHDFRSIQKHGVIGPAVRDKDAVLFPERIGGRIGMLHRIHPDIQLILFRDLDELKNPPADLWAQHLAELDRHVILRPEQEWEAKKIGAGPTPIRTPEGWLLIYHGVDDNHVYRAGLALLDLENPNRVIARSSRPVLEPELEFELHGDVDNVVFPEGAAVIDGILHVYYGAADRVIGRASASLEDVLQYFRQEAAAS